VQGVQLNWQNRFNRPARNADQKASRICKNANGSAEWIWKNKQEKHGYDRIIMENHHGKKK
jgi:hypothetical protein